MKTIAAMVQPVPARSVADFERRLAERHASEAQVLSRPLEAAEAIAWGATVRDISASGIGLSLCYPFSPGTFLAIDLQLPGGGTRTLLSRVVHARDQADGTWHIGCEFVKELSASDLEMVI
jgi:hypothetical protein